MDGLDIIAPDRQERAGPDPWTDPRRGLAAMVGAAFGIGAESLAQGSRGRAEVAFARQVAMYLAHTRLKLRITAAGALFGRDRTTAAHACRRVEELREDKRVDTLIDCLERALDLRPGQSRNGG